MHATVVLTFLVSVSLAQAPDNARRPRTDAELEQWLENMLVYHRFTDAEMAAAIGLLPDEIAAAITRFDLRGKQPPERRTGDPLLVLPYPGGRHPRIGFLDGAVRPQRETKISVFTPWQDGGYVVVDVPEAIWFGEGQERQLLYLAHTHVPTYWTKQGIELEPLEWSRAADGSLHVERSLPNGVTFGTAVWSDHEAVRMRVWIRNGTRQKLTGLRVQNCMLLKGARGFEAQTRDNKTISPPYVACRNETGDRWTITAWEPHLRSWANPPCPCMHSDPQFPDCGPNETQQVRGWLSFYEGSDIDVELKRIEATNWRRAR